MQRLAQVDAPSLEIVVPAIAYHFCLNLPVALTQPGASNLTDVCNSQPHVVTFKGATATSTQDQRLTTTTCNCETTTTRMVTTTTSTSTITAVGNIDDGDVICW